LPAALPRHVDATMPPTLPTHAAFGSEVPLAEPSWYQNLNSPYYNASHVAWRAKLRDFFEREVEPSESLIKHSKKTLRRETHEARVPAVS
jgi:hypothetical protein